MSHPIRERSRRDGDVPVGDPRPNSRDPDRVTGPASKSWKTGPCCPTFLVNTTADSGPGSLRQAILDSNAATGGNSINFNIPGTGVQTIALQSALPTITTAVVIDGYSQPGASPNTEAESDNAVLRGRPRRIGGRLPRRAGDRRDRRHGPGPGRSPILQLRYPPARHERSGRASPATSSASTPRGDTRRTTSAIGDPTSTIRVRTRSGARAPGIGTSSRPATTRKLSCEGRDRPATSCRATSSAPMPPAPPPRATLTVTVSGVELVDGASGNLIGGTSPGAGNVISANGGDGVQISGYSGDSTEQPHRGKPDRHRCHRDIALGNGGLWC